MDSTIKKTLRAVGLTKILDSPTKCDEFVNFAVQVWAQGKGIVSNGPQLPFLAIHIACLTNGVELDNVFLQKKSTLNQKSYQATLISLMSIIKTVNSSVVAKYYGSTTLQSCIEELCAEVKEQKEAAVIASLYLIGHLGKLPKSFGTVGELALLWGQPAELVKEMSVKLKAKCDVNKLKEYGKRIFEEMKSAKINSSVTDVKSPRPKRSFTPSPTKNNSAKIQKLQVHPLYLFNCSSKGPAFGPILFQ